MTQYEWWMEVHPSKAKTVHITRKEDAKDLRFYIATSGGEEYLRKHMDSLTDDHCEQWFDEQMSTEERKAKQVLRKERARLERLEIEARVAAQKAETLRLKTEEKERKRAERLARTQTS